MVGIQKEIRVHQNSVLLVALTASVLVASPFLGAGEPARELSWKKTDSSIALHNNGKMVWQHVHDKKAGKPFMRFGLLDGTEMTRPCPFPNGYAKADHVWHKALWWSWKYINGVNFWEKTQEGTEPVGVKIEERDNGSAVISLDISYHEKDKPTLVKEKRVITVSSPDSQGSYRIDWEATFTPAGNKDVVFNKNSYGGFAYRGAAEYCGDKKNGQQGWRFVDDEGRIDGSNNKRCRWVAYVGIAQNVKAAGVAIFEHPDNPRHPSWWQTRNHYPYLNPSFTCKEDYTLEAGKSLALKYRVLVHQGDAGKEVLEKEWKAFAGKSN